MRLRFLPLPRRRLAQPPRWARGLGGRLWGGLGLSLWSLAAQAQPRPLLQLDLRAADLSFDQMTVYFEPGATPALDNDFDAPKLPNAPGVASFETSGQQLATNGLPPTLLTAPLTVDLFVGMPTYGTYTLQVSKLEYFTATTVYLTDALRQTTSLLALGATYDFDLTAANTNDTYTTSTRFALQFVPSPPAPLPVVLASFTARGQPGGVQLAWRTASEVNSAYFAVERSLGGQVFAELGRVAAAGTRAVAHPYNWLDADPLAGAGPRYYRLRQVDLDGTSTYSPVRLVAVASTGLALFPNPAHGAATLCGAGAGAAVEVVDVLGRPRLCTKADAGGTAQLRLPPGLYLVRTGPHTLRLVVQ